MSTRLFLYGLWCLSLILASLIALYYGYSPFADGRGDRQSSGIYGPTHK
jgi:hypothetical protein